MITQQLIITCAGGVKGLLDVSENETLADVRSRLYNELDADLSLPHFGFYIIVYLILVFISTEIFAFQRNKKGIRKVGIY